MSKAKTHIVVAHKLEAKALIKLFKLEVRTEKLPYAVYTNRQGLDLIISGMGRKNAAAATSWFAEFSAQDRSSASAWLNIGICGHHCAAIGDGLLAKKITEKASGKCFYPGMLLEGFTSTDIITVDEVERHYSSQAAYEMEASAFYAQAQKVSSSELIQVFKIVSDNPSRHVDDIKLDEIELLIHRQGEQIKSLIAALASLLEEQSAIYTLPQEFYQIESSLRLTATQKIQLKRLCQRIQAQGKLGQLRELSKANIQSARELLNSLESMLS